MKKTSAEPERCSYCGKELDEEDLALFAKHGPLECPSCLREGCHECMPSGRNCYCPQCEEKENE
jgi:hypothetical protein